MIWSPQEWKRSCLSGSVPAIHDDGVRILPLDVIDGRRVICNDWVIPEYRSQKIGSAKDIERVEAAIAAGELCYVIDEVDEFYPEDLTADYFLPSQWWRHSAIIEANKMDEDYRHILNGILRGYSDNDINAYIWRNREWFCGGSEDIYKTAMEAWQKAYDWLHGRRS